MKIIVSKKLFMWALLSIYSCAQILYAQTIDIKGTVRNQKQEPLVDVTITSASGQKTSTSAQGSFTIKATAGELLTFSSVGYLTVQQAARANMQVTLQVSDIELEEITVVGVGYGTARKSDLTGAISSVSAKDLRQGVITSAEQLLQGKVAGLSVVQPSGDPAQGSTLRLRGGTSLSASNNPLIVVDGIPGADMNTIQPSEIVSIDVLKDASAAAIYGSRGANGVILVTTNRESSAKTMNYTGFVGVGRVAKNLDLLSANQWRKYVRDSAMVNAVDFGGDTNWQEELQRTAITNSHNLSFANGNKDGGIRGSIGYLNSEGIIKTSSLQRLSGTLTGYQRGLNDRLRLEAGIYTNRDNYHPIDIGVFQRAYNLNPTLPVMQDGVYTQVAGTEMNNPVEMLMQRRDDQSRNRLLGYGKAELNILDDLKATAIGSYEYNAQQGRFFSPANSFLGSPDKGYGRRNLGEFQNFQLETYLNYNKEINADNRLDVMVGYSFLQNLYEGFGAERRGFDTDLFGYNNLGAGNDFRLGDVYSYKGEAKLISFFGRVNYALMDRYIITGTLRRDGSTRFGANNKWGLFPSVSAAWRISEEQFMESTKSWLNNLKLRAGYGVTGNQDGIGEYRSLSLMGTGGGAYYDHNTGSWKQSYSISQNPNPNLKWETTAQTNIGLDFSLFNRFNVTLEGYVKKTSDLLFTYSVPQPPYLYDNMLANVGDLTNKGFEATIGATIIRKKDFDWTANVVLARNIQTIDRLSNDIYQTDVVYTGHLHGLSGMSGVYTQVIREGYPVGAFWGPKYVGMDDKGKTLLEKDAEGKVIQQYLGNVQPKFTLGFATNFVYKDFDLNIAANGMFGHKILNAQAMNMSSLKRMPTGNVPDRFVGEGKTASDAPVYSDYWIEKADFLRLQTLTLGYNIPTNPTWFKRIRVYCTGENLFVLTGYKGIDPEVNISGLKSPGIDKSIGTAEHGDNYYYPRARTFSFGVNLSF